MAIANRAADSVSIVVDDRETGSSVLQALRDLEDVKVTVRRLPLGDYLVDDRILFERKTLLDLAESIKDGRLFRQACRLAASPKKTVILLEGTAADLASSHMRREAIQGALITLSVILGIPLLRSLSPEESARLMLYTARQIQAAVSGAIPRKGARPKGKRALQLHILQGLPGIGPTRAERLLVRFGTVENVLQALPDDPAQCEELAKQPHGASAGR
jgi:DNA excision repair protein ERCC-4